MGGSRSLEVGEKHLLAAVTGLREIDVNVLAEEVESKYISKSDEALITSASAMPPSSAVTSFTPCWHLLLLTVG